MSDFDFMGDDFVPGDEPDTDEFEVVPPARYFGTIKRAEIVETSKGGKMLKVAVAIDGPTHKGCWVWGNINIQNANEVAQRIGRQQFSRLCVASGFTKRPPARDEDFIGCEVDFKTKYDTYQGEKRGVIKTFCLPKNAAPTTAPEPATASKGGNPWA